MCRLLLPASAERLSEEICRSVMRAYLDGISHVDRCSQSGRALMLVDLRNLEHSLEKSTGLHPIPEAEKVSLFSAMTLSFFMPSLSVDSLSRLPPDCPFSFLQCRILLSERTCSLLTTKVSTSAFAVSLQVENYIKAYYLSESDLIVWVSNNAKRYKLTLKQAAILGEVGPGR